MSDDPRDIATMRLALDQAQNAWLVGEVPIGAIIVRDTPGGRQTIATGYNRPITDVDPTAHAEIVALRHAAQLLGNYRLPECELFVTLEPCPMCAMALLHARVKRVVFGAADPKAGAAGSVIDVFGNPALNHHTGVTGGVLGEESAAALRAFFAERREQYRQRRQYPLFAPTGTDSAGADVAAESIPAGETDFAAEPIPAGESVEVDDPRRR